MLPGLQHQFHERIAQLVYTFPEDAVTSTGSLFWSAPKRFPHALDFDPKDPSHAHFAQAAAILRAEVYGIPVPAWALNAAKVLRCPHTQYWCIASCTSLLQKPRICKPPCVFYLHESVCPAYAKACQGALCVEQLLERHQEISSSDGCLLVHAEAVLTKIAESRRERQLGRYTSRHLCPGRGCR